MPEVQRLVGVRRRELHHDASSSLGELAERGILKDGIEVFVPVDIGKRQVKESLDRIVRADFRAVCLDPLAYRRPGGVRRLPCETEKREHDNREVSFKFLARGLDLEGR